MVKKFKVGTVQLKKDKSGVTLAVGSQSKDPKYVTNIEITVKDGNGKVLAKAENGFLQIVDPRKRTNKDGTPLTEDQLAKIPAWVKNEVYLVVNEE